MPTPPTCGATLTHAHGVSHCPSPPGHDGQHTAWCGACHAAGQDDPGDRLEWERDGESWLDTGTERPADPPPPGGPPESDSGSDGPGGSDEPPPPPTGPWT
ncbi:hypothetical protein ACWGNE_02510 [Streptomyces xiamenensis]